MPSFRCRKEGIHDDGNLFTQQVLGCGIPLRSERIETVGLCGVDIAFVRLKRMMDAHDAHIFRQFAVGAGFKGICSRPSWKPAVM